jgi:hypothetical protein
MINDFNIDKMIKWVGAKGTRAALNGSDTLTFEELAIVAENNSIEIPPNAKKKEIIDRLLLKYDKCINRSIEELEKMSSEELIDYLTKSKATEVEIIELLNKADIPIIKFKSKKKLIEFTANSISSLGIYQRISSL